MADEWVDGELPSRIWSKIDSRDAGAGCWLWTAGCTRGGYGKTFLDGKQVYVHRVIYEALVGPIPPGQQLDHRCHVRHCCNPAHLQVVDTTGNAQNRRGAQVNSRSGIRGVHPFGPRWRVQVRAGGRIHSGGVFDDLELAAQAARALRERLMANPGD